MAFRFFVVPARAASGADAELNAFLRSHRVLAVDRRWVELGENSFWSFCIDYLESTGNPQAGRPGVGKSKIDNRELLSPADFAVFAKLRDLRKALAQEEAVPVYTVFTNDQLAQMVQAKAALERIAGVGDARIEKYGPRLLEFLTQVYKGADQASEAVP